MATTTTPNLGLTLAVPGSNEPFDTATVNANFTALDTNAGLLDSRLDVVELLGVDTGWSKTPFTAMTGWGSVARLGIRKIGKLVVCSVELTRTGASITADASGNIGDTAVATLTAPYRIGVGSELIHSMSYTKAGVAMGAWRLDSGGELQIETLHTGNSINTNDAIRLYGVWFTP